MKFWEDLGLCKENPAVCHVVSRELTLHPNYKQMGFPNHACE